MTAARDSSLRGAADVGRGVGRGEGEGSKVTHRPVLTERF